MNWFSALLKKKRATYNVDESREADDDDGEDAHQGAVQPGLDDPSGEALQGDREELRAAKWSGCESWCRKYFSRSHIIPTFRLLHLNERHNSALPAKTAGVSFLLMLRVLLDLLRVWKWAKKKKEEGLIWRCKQPAGCIQDLHLRPL